MNNPEVSIIMAVYNPGPALHRMMESLLAQTFASFELIAVDDGSSDGSADILDNFARRDTRIHVVHQENQGQNIARNNGMKLCRGNYVYICDHDDYLHPQALAYCVKLLQDTGASFMTFYGDIANDSDLPHPANDDVINASPVVILDTNFAANHPHEFTTVMTRLQMDCWGQFIKGDLARATPYLSSYDTSRTFRLIVASPIWIASQAKLYTYFRSNPSSMTHKPVRAQWVKALEADMIRVAEIYSQATDKVIQWRIIRKSHIARNVKIMVNTARRNNHLLSAEERADSLHAIVNMLNRLLALNCLTARDLGLRRYLVYKWMILRNRW